MRRAQRTPSFSTRSAATWRRAPSKNAAAACARRCGSVSSGAWSRSRDSRWRSTRWPIFCATASPASCTWPGKAEMKRPCRRWPGSFRRKAISVSWARTPIPPRSIATLTCSSARPSANRLETGDRGPYAGCPVVAAAVDGLPEVVQHEKTGLCIQPTLPISDYPQFGGSPDQCPRWVYDPLKDALQPPKLLDPRAIAQAVKAVINPPERWRAMSGAARERALRDFRMDDFALRLNRQLLDVCRHGD